MLQIDTKQLAVAIINNIKTIVENTKKDVSMHIEHTALSITYKNHTIICALLLSDEETSNAGEYRCFISIGDVSKKYDIPTYSNAMIADVIFNINAEFDEIDANIIKREQNIKELQNMIKGSNIQDITNYIEEKQNKYFLVYTYDDNGFLCVKMLTKLEKNVAAYISDNNFIYDYPTNKEINNGNVIYTYYRHDDADGPKEPVEIFILELYLPENTYLTLTESKRNTSFDVLNNSDLPFKKHVIDTADSILNNYEQEYIDALHEKIENVFNNTDANAIRFEWEDDFCLVKNISEPILSGKPVNEITIHLHQIIE